jgi:hypothetical protein
MNSRKKRDDCQAVLSGVQDFPKGTPSVQSRVRHHAKLSLRTPKERSGVRGFLLRPGRGGVRDFPKGTPSLQSRVRHHAKMNLRTPKETRGVRDISLSGEKRGSARLSQRDTFGAVSRYANQGPRRSRVITDQPSATLRPDSEARHPLPTVLHSPPIFGERML